MSKRDFLVEIGAEELPPKSLFALAEAFRSGVVQGLDAAGLQHGDAQWFATPRRLAVRVNAVSDQQPDQKLQRQGPAVSNAFDAQGQPTKAALGFAASCGVSLDELQQVDGPKGKVLQFVGLKKGAPAVELLPNIVAKALDQLPIAKRMRWGAGAQEFVRPVHWIVMLFGTSVIETELFGVRSGKRSRGHRFHAPQEITIASPAKYVELLFEKGRVMADVDARRERIRSGVAELAASLQGQAVITPELLDEVTALVEWPVPIAGQFDAKFLELPQEVPIATMQDHQRYFPVRDAAGQLMNHFITVANIESREPQKVRDGNERVVRPRLADAAFFWETDRQQRLESRREALQRVTYQNKLGSQFERTERIARLAERIAESIAADSAAARRAAELCKCDLLTLMVNEFPELQGLMGKYYALHGGEQPEVAAAIEQQYWPRFAGDQLPDTPVGIAVSLADKLDLIAGIFCIGQKPSGTRDPFGVRRAALGILRIIMERSLELDLRRSVEGAVAVQPIKNEGAVEEIWDYLMERLRGTYLEGEGERAISTEMFDAVIANRVGSPLDIDQRLGALEAFLALPEAASLAAASKRIANILRKAEGEISTAVEVERLSDGAERQLFEHVVAMERALHPLFARREYQAALTQLATLREDVDRFFDSVLVMADDPAVRHNRLALLLRLRALFLQVADLSRLPG